MTPIKVKYLIIGAGPTGLGAAWKLKELHIKNFALLERNVQVGGLARTLIDYKGFLWDIGGHVQFSHYKYFDDVMNEAIPPHNWLNHKRAAFIRMNKQYIPYPFQRNLKYLSPGIQNECLSGLKNVSNATQPTNFAEWIDDSFGSGIARYFMLPYNFKVWAFPAKKLSHKWISERVAPVSYNDVVKKLHKKKEDTWGPNATFRFPLNGGTGEIWKRVGNLIDEANMFTNQNVESINRDQKLVHCANNITFKYEYILNTIPLKELCRIISPELDPKTRKMSNDLLHSSTHVVGVGLKGRPPESLAKKSWIYFPESNSPYYRTTVFSNYSPNNVPAGEYWSVMTETSESKYKPVNRDMLVDDTIRALTEDGLIDEKSTIVSRFHHFEPYGYPTPSLNRDSILKAVLPKLENYGIYSRGRFGGWKYEVSNQDHSFMQGVEWVDKMELGAKETTYFKPNMINNPNR